MLASGWALASRVPTGKRVLFFDLKHTAGARPHHERRAQRFLSTGQPTWRRADSKPVARAPISKYVPEEKRAKTGALRSRIVRFVIRQLRQLALKEEGTELSDLAKYAAQYYEDGESRKNPEFGLLLHSCEQAWVDEGDGGLEAQIKYTLHGILARRKIGEGSVEEQAKLADLRYPLEWYPATRTIQRTIHLHVGPTNSGKTYHALKRLEQAKTGIYAGPLRLLAHEVYTRLNANGKKCHLITGDDRRINAEADQDTDAMISCTVEMVPINAPVDVAVVDEIQMIGHNERGWAWSQALLGLQAKELHLCGEARTVPLIRELAAAMGDKLVIHFYERLSPLKCALRSLQGDLKKLSKGDCLVAFSRREIHSLKSEIERMTNKRVAIIYGSLPPETRARQAQLFNDPNNDYDYLVASDAIGMGLNLDIKRIVFESTFKFDGKSYQPIPIPHLKQIAGRAGRYRIAPQSKNPEVDAGDGTPNPSGSKSSRERASSSTVGIVTTLERLDFPRLQRAMATEAEPVMSAGIFPPTSVLIKFAAYFPPGTPFSYVLQRLHEVSSLHPRYHLCDIRDTINIADMLEEVRDLAIEDRIVFCAAPVAVHLAGFQPILVSFAKCVADSSKFPSSLLDIPNLPLEILDAPITKDREYLTKLETLHKALILYIWLSYRFAGVFTTQKMAFYVKGLVEAKIDKVLAQVSSSRKKKLRSLRQLAMLEELGPELGSTKTEDERLVAHTVQSPSQGFRFGLQGAEITKPDDGSDEISPAESQNDGNQNYYLPEQGKATFGWDQVPEDIDPDQKEKARPEMTADGKLW